MHSAIDDRTRLGYSEIHTNETGPTAAGFWRRAAAFYALAGVACERVLTDNGPCYRSNDFAEALKDTRTSGRRTREGSHSEARPTCKGHLGEASASLPMSDGAYQPRSRRGIVQVAQRQMRPGRCEPPNREPSGLCFGWVRPGIWPLVDCPTSV